MVCPVPGRGGGGDPEAPWSALTPSAPGCPLASLPSWCPGPGQGFLLHMALWAWCPEQGWPSRSVLLAGWHPVPQVAPSVLVLGSVCGALPGRVSSCPMSLLIGESLMDLGCWVICGRQLCIAIETSGTETQVSECLECRLGAQSQERPPTTSSGCQWMCPNPA